MAAENESKRRRAEELYIHSDFNQKEIGEIIQVSDKTLRTWKIKYQWDELKKNHAVTAPKIIAALQEKLYQLSKADAIQNADKIAKIAAAMDKLKGRKLTLSNYLEVLVEFIEYLRPQDEALAQQLSLHAKAFIKTRLQQPNKIKDLLNEKIHGED